MPVVFDLSLSCHIFWLLQLLFLTLGSCRNAWQLQSWTISVFYIKSFQKPCEIDSKRSKTEVWRELRFGSLLGLGFILCPGVYRGSWPRCGGVLEAPRGVLGGSWGACGTVLGRLWCDLGRLGVVLVPSSIPRKVLKNWWSWLRNRSLEILKIKPPLQRELNFRYFDFSKELIHNQ